MRFRKRPPGKHKWKRNGRWEDVLPGEVVDCEKSELGNFLDLWEQLDPEPEELPGPMPTRGLFAQHRAFKGHWDVINPETGLPINDHALTKAQAQAMIEGEMPGDFED